jgi:oligopeptidase B
MSSVLAFAVDLRGDCIYEIRFLDIPSRCELPQRIRLATGNMVWSSDGQVLFYCEPDPDTLRWRRIKRYLIGSDPASTEIVYEERDETFSCSVYCAKSHEFIFIHSSSGDEDETHYLVAANAFGAFQVVQQRQAGLEYQVQHAAGSSFIIRTNLLDPNFRLMRTSINKPTSMHWVELVSSAGAFIEGFEVFRDHIAVKERREGAIRIRVLRLSDCRESLLTFNHSGQHCVDFVDNWESDSPTLRYEFSSLTEPTAVYDYRFDTGLSALLKKDTINGFDGGAYVAAWLHVPQAGGVSIPITLLYRKDRESSPKPVVLYGYGAYGISLDPCFSLARMSLVDRGFVFALAHVRGGGEFGRDWHYAGRQQCKLNSILDYIACAEYLHSAGIAHRDGIFALAESAGAVLVGAAINERPDLFRAVVAIAPFVDVLNSLLDPTIPLTTTDFTEWGNPGNPVDYNYIKRYSPYDNVRRQEYPHLLAMSAINDVQVPIWHAARWVAKIRDSCTKEKVLLLRTELDTGHLGQSGRYAHHWETALAYAFFLGIWEGVLGTNEDPCKIRIG